VAQFDGGYREWRAAVGEGWTAADALARRSGRPVPAATARSRPVAPRPAPAVDGARPSPLSKDAYRREHQRIEADLERLGERKSALESALEEPEVQANFVELRRLGSELADVDSALSQAEDAWLTLEERAPR
jgi:hypothetical protein